jgi:hypothetical protein
VKLTAKASARLKHPSPLPVQESVVRSLELAAGRQGEDVCYVKFCLLRLSVGLQKRKAQIGIGFGLELKRT